MEKVVKNFILTIRDATLFALVLVWFGLVWQGLAQESQERNSKSKTFDQKSESKLNFILTIRDATLFGLVWVQFGLVCQGLAWELEESQYYPFSVSETLLGRICISSC